MDTPTPRRPRLPWQAVLIATVLAIGAAMTTYVLVDDGQDAPASETNTDLTLTPLGEEGPVADREAALELPFTRLDGSETSLAEVVDGPAVVNFFASWCAPCVGEMPDFETVSQETAGEVMFFGLAVQDRPEDAQRIASTTGISYGWGRDVRGDIVAAVGSISMPTTIFVSAAGEIVYVKSGAVPIDELRSLIEEYLGVTV